MRFVQIKNHPRLSPAETVQLVPMAAVPSYGPELATAGGADFCYQMRSFPRKALVLTAATPGLPSIVVDAASN